MLGKHQLDIRKRFNHPLDAVAGAAEGGLNMKRKAMGCCVGCRNYQRCRVCEFENDVACVWWKLEWLFCRIGKLFGRK